MTHEVTSAAYSRQPAWHRLGITVDRDMTADEALRLAGLDWSPVRSPIYTRSLTAGGCWETEVPDRHAITRSDTGAVLGTVSGRYHVVPHSRLFGIARSIERVRPGASVESAVELQGGRSIVCLVRMGAWSIGGDESVDYLCLSTSHDGSSAVRSYPTSIRVVCKNTVVLSEGIADRRNLIIRIPHDADAMDRLDTLEESLSFAAQGLSEWQSVARTLADRPMTARQLDDTFRYVAEALHPEPGVPESSAEHRRWTGRRDRTLDKLWIGEAKYNGPGIKCSGWSAFNAITGVLQHDRGTDGTRSRRALDPGSTDSARKLDLARMILAGV
jgi:phage/plasmid-like protein (TIGR03299 family)